jgi:hypothetical protein
MGGLRLQILDQEAPPNKLLKQAAAPRRDCHPPPVACGEVPRARSLPPDTLSFLMRPLLNGGTLGERRMRKSVELGDSGAVSGVAALLWLSFAVVAFSLLRHRLSGVAIYSLCLGLGWPLGLLRRRFGRRLLLLVDDDFVWLPHGQFGPARIFPIAAVRSVAEWRLVEAERSTLPTWSLVLHMVDGTELRLGQTSTPTIHEVVRDLNSAIQLRAARVSPI